MIGRLEGRLHQVRPGEVVVDVAGVGYLVRTTLRAFEELARSERASFWVHTMVRSDAIALYGFTERAEQEAFERLLGVAGVGPRMALAVLSGLTAGELAAAVDGGDAARLSRVPGIGRKTAERIVLELRGRLQAGGEAVPDRRGDAVSALSNLGYSTRDAERAVEQALSSEPKADLAEILRLALKGLTR